MSNGGAAPTGAAALQSAAQDLAALVVPQLIERGWTLAVAESLTAGLLCGTFASVPGVSQVLRGGVVSYATELKAELLGVDAGLLASGGAVQAEVALQMAAGVAGRLRADVALATTGVAGPDPQDGNAAGTVYVAVHGAGPDQVLARFGATALPGSRDEVRWASVLLGVQLLADRLAAPAADSSE